MNLNEYKLKKQGLFAAVALCGLSALNAQEAQAAFKIESTSSYSTVVNEEKFKNLADWQARNEERFAALYDSMREFAAGRYTGTDVANNLNPADVMREGDTLAVYGTRGSVIGSTLETEPIVRIGSGSNVPVRDGASGRELAVDPSRNVTLAGKEYAFAGGDFTGMVSIGDLRSATPVVRKLSGLAAATLSDTSVEAVNGSQLHATNKALNTLKGDVDKNTAEIGKGIKFGDGQGNVVKISLGDTLNLKSPDTNIRVNVNPTTKEALFGLNPDLSLNSATYGTRVIINGDGINAGNTKITNVKAGEVSATSTDAVNGSQLYNALQNLNIGGGNNGGNPNAVLYDNAERTSVTLVGNGGTSITNVKAGDVSSTSTDAINGSQLYTTNTNVAKNTADIAKGYGATTDDGKTAKKPLGEYLSIKGGKNITTSTDNNGRVVISTNNNIDANQFTAGDVIINHQTGINSGGMTISNVKAGDISEHSKEAVNGSQLYSTNIQVAENTDKINRGITYVGDTGSTVTRLGDSLNIKGGEDGNIRTQISDKGISLNLNPDIRAHSISLGDVYLSDNHVNVGGNIIQNVGKGAISATSTDAVNGSQLYDVYQDMDTNRAISSRGIAAAAAADIEYVEHDAGGWTIGVGVGHYDKQTALGLGVMKTSDNGRYKMNFALGQPIAKKNATPLVKGSFSWNFH